ncbi:acetyltransferase [Halalkalibacterium halodurans]|uniref:acetyltransferase n=1 Tax=Halalkalibacterium halodurans TaxID=86665 RepID=UPI002E20DC00|nr:acetyltransferase [Halalkalibacterium halodurans]MED4083730.1 acetyltransferase [Halalkalibacterium halodurans]MED4106581.1 acetyltransferase [Halalkalibacterium halodurans]MED4109571.1 acetyltransferase [Halalkalibacterium halodurans]MED4150953.1 acetyltransferase [Halalkalibacterium halodurans]
MKDKLLIIGASGHGKVIADIALQMNRWNTILFLDDNERVKRAMGLDVIGKTKDVDKFIADYDIFIGIGNNQIREKLQNQLKASQATIPTLIHPSAVIGSKVAIGQGTAVMAGAVINCCSKIGDGCIVNTGATIDHDNCIEDYVHISPGVNIAGSVKVGRSSWLGIGSKVSNNIDITSNCIIGAGGVVVQDIYESGTYVGVPVKKI